MLLLVHTPNVEHCMVTWASVTTQWCIVNMENAPAGPKIVLVPPRSMFKCLSALGRSPRRLYTLYFKNTLLSNHFQPCT